jgi:hypothetical protein
MECCTRLLPVDGSGNNSLSIVICRHVYEKRLFRRTVEVCIFFGVGYYDCIASTLSAAPNLLNYLLMALHPLWTLAALSVS